MTVAPWAELADLPAGRPAGLSDAEWERLIAQASEVLYQLSGGRYAGERRRTVEVWSPPAGAAPTLLDHEHLLIGTCWGAPHTGCRNPSSLRLPGFPVTEVHEVTVAGAVRDPATYRLWVRRYLETVGSWSWPLCSGVLVDYTAGRTAPAAAREAAVDYALALGEARIDPDRSRLPGAQASITRQGITITYKTALDFTKAGKVGVAAVDNWLAAVNPTGRRHRPSAWSPDTDSKFYPQPTP